MNTRVDADATAQRQAFDAMLARLQRDGDAGLGYEALRRRLLLFFRLHAPVEASELADVTLDRLARKLAAGTQVDSVPLYTLGIARMVLREVHTRRARWHAVESDPDLIPDPQATDATEPPAADPVAVAALARCLDGLPAQARALVLAYYAAEGSARIAIRQRLATEQGISLNALRNRMLRLRSALERCVRARLGPTGRP